MKSLKQELIDQAVEYGKRTERYKKDNMYIDNIDSPYAIENLREALDKAYNPEFTTFSAWLNAAGYEIEPY